MQPKWPIRFCGTGAYVPAHVLTNQHFADYLDTSDEWIVTRTGIRERRRVAPEERTSTMAIQASRRALADAAIPAGDLDVIVCATATGDYPFPSTAAILQNELGASHAAAFDISAACAGFVHATTVASALLTAGMHRRALVIGAETLTRFADPEDRRTAILFGDGAGAAVLERAEAGSSAPGILYCDLGCDGSHLKDIWVPAGGSALPASNTTVAERLHFMKMRGREVYKFAVVKMQRLIDEALQTAGLTPEDLKLVIPHQSNLRIIESVRERLRLSREKVSVTIDRFGNTSAASVIMALDEGRRNGTLTAGDIVLLVAIGAGLTWGIMIVRL
jgi:3-oxoacyl-[acyl-carrier-protein] synthase-3